MTCACNDLNNSLELGYSIVMKKLENRFADLLTDNETLTICFLRMDTKDPVAACAVPPSVLRRGRSEYSGEPGIGKEQ